MVRFMIVSSSTERRLDEDIAEALLRDEPALVSSLDFGPFVRQGIGNGPSLLIGDQSEIALVSPVTGSRLEYRMALLARPGDSVLVRHRDADFETYLSAYLTLVNVKFHQADPRSHIPTTRQAWTSQKWVDTFAAVAQKRSGLTIKPYLTTGHAWRLAQAIGERSGQIVYVSGPSARVTRRANNKLWFTELARRVIGQDATPPTRAAYGPAATAGLVRQISNETDQVIVKVPDSAGSAGNLRLESATIRERSLRDLRQFLLGRLYAVGWHDSYPLLVGVWDKNVICSPSVQLWVPHVSQSEPKVEGIFEQRVQTSAATFVGASRSTLQRTIQDQLGMEATRIATVLQRLGYFGRCSLDAVICRTPDAPSLIHWIECNGRWGGVSIPMTASGQLLGNPPPNAISIVQEMLPEQHLSTKDLLLKLKDLLFKTNESQTGLIVLSPPHHPKGALINLLAAAETQQAVDDMLHDAMRRLKD